jgi:hypothetical protein
MGCRHILSKPSHSPQKTAAEVDIARRPDGSEWLLGSGGFGRVRQGLTAQLAQLHWVSQQLGGSNGGCHAGRLHGRCDLRKPHLLLLLGLQGPTTWSAAGGCENHSGEEECHGGTVELGPPLAVCATSTPFFWPTATEKHTTQRCLPSSNKVVRRCALLLGVQVRGDQQHPAAQAEVRQEIAILRACRDVNIVQFVVRRAGLRAGLGC